MAFENLTQKINQAMRNIVGKGKLSERNMDEMLQEIRLALLEADVNYQVVSVFLSNIKEKAVGMKVYQSVEPSQMVVKIVHDEMVKLLGESEASINFKLNALTTVMVVGLQGTGKTTNLAKIAKSIKDKNGRKPLIIAADIVRPAAIEQLKTLGDMIDVEVFSLGSDTLALKTVKAGMEYARKNSFDTVLIDTAGRLHVDEVLMQELVDIKKEVKPDEILLTVDAMTGQDIITVANSFNEKLSITGLIVTKFDGDARGGAIFSIRSVTGVPIKYVGTGEKIDDLELFYPDRVADRILGMGDIVSLVEKAQEKLDMEEQMKAAQRMMEGRFDLDDMAYQLKQVNKLGSIKGILQMIPGMNQLSDQVNEEQANKDIKINVAIIESMTKEERSNPDIIRMSRKHRIANGSGTTVAQVNKLLSQFEKMKSQMKMMSRLGKKKGWKM
ncbi:MAG: signal recognition particle protein [Erysipelotrichaceae bacterium]|nr:signal recognition particle protein [Erysipelotrichaceae bacterium]